MKRLCCMSLAPVVWYNICKLWCKHDIKVYYNYSKLPFPIHRTLLHFLIFVDLRNSQASQGGCRGVGLAPVILVLISRQHDDNIDCAALIDTLFDSVPLFQIVGSLVLQLSTVSVLVFGLWNRVLPSLFSSSLFHLCNFLLALLYMLGYFVLPFFPLSLFYQFLSFLREEKRKAFLCEGLMLI